MVAWLNDQLLVLWVSCHAWLMHDTLKFVPSQLEHGGVHGTGT